MSDNKTVKPSPDFDGHINYDLKKMTPKEKLEYLSRQIELHFFIHKKVKKAKKLQ